MENQRTPKLENITTPRKRLSEENASQDSPVTKKLSGYDFWASLRKVPKVVQEDLKPVRIEDLQVTRSLSAPIDLKISGIMKTEKVFKFAAFQGRGFINVVSFREDMERLSQFVNLGCSVRLTNVEIGLENDQYSTGATGGLQIVFGPKSNVVQIPDMGKDIIYNFLTIEEARSLAAKERLDLLVILCESLGLKETKTGLLFRGGLTDYTMSSIPISVFGENASVLNEKAGSVLKIRNALLGNFRDEKNIVCDWWSDIEVDPSDAEALKLKTWFTEACNVELAGDPVVDIL